MQILGPRHVSVGWLVFSRLLKRIILVGNFFNFVLFVGLIMNLEFYKV